MTAAIRTYLLSVVAISMAAGILQALVPKGSVRRTLNFLCGLAILLVTIQPLVQLDADRIAEAIAGLQLDSYSYETEVQSDNQELMAAIIKEKAETYILDKAAGLGFSLEVEVEVRADSETPYPYSAVLRAACSGTQRDQLARVIEQDLAIPVARQEWNTYEKE